jgi:hypothetical protein
MITLVLMDSVYAVAARPDPYENMSTLAAAAARGEVARLHSNEARPVYLRREFLGVTADNREKMCSKATNIKLSGSQQKRKGLSHMLAV